MYRFALFLLASIALSASVQASTEPLSQPAGKVVLTVSGNIAVTNRTGAADFDLDTLRQMPVTVVKTETPWTEGTQTFEGVLVRDLLARVGSSGAVVEATALNDYKMPMPMTDFATSNVIIAYLHNGRPMPVRDKGPLWIIYPTDTHLPDVKSKMIWQLRSLTIR